MSQESLPAHRIDVSYRDQAETRACVATRCDSSTRAMTDLARDARQDPRLMPVLEASLRQNLALHLTELGFQETENGMLMPPTNTKEALRRLHVRQRMGKLLREQPFVQREWSSLNEHFADGTDVDPARIAPRIELIAADTWQSRLFRMAALTWSIPVSYGYGRRLRYLVWDDSNNRLIGLMALGDPVFNLSVRDSVLGWSSQERARRLVHMMDAYVLGALPPYNALLCGKLVACLVRSKEVRDDFRRRYGSLRGTISHRTKRARLVMVTTSSALGRSSVYNRLTLGETRYFRSIGYTKGWGHFHIPDDLFGAMRSYLSLRNDAYAHNYRYGQGPNWRLRAIRRALDLIGFDSNTLRHGVQREVFVSELARNARSFLRGMSKRPDYRGLLTVAETSRLALERWVLPRAQRRAEYRTWNRQNLLPVLEGRSTSGVLRPGVPVREEEVVHVTG